METDMVETMTPTDAQRTAYEQSSATRFESTLCFLLALRHLNPSPKTMIDVGCGPGHLVKISAALGMRSLGVDINIAEQSFGDGWALTYSDLSNRQFWDRWPMGLHPTFADLVLCLEVAEHLPPVSADTLCDTLTAAVAPGGTLLFSAATPGQGGSGHLNEQPHEYWVNKLRERGLALHLRLTEIISSEWSQFAKSAWWYGCNVCAMKKDAR